MIKIVQWNCRGLASKLSELSNWINDIDIVCLQETWLNKRNSAIFIDFITFRDDRKENTGGDVVILCRKSLDPTSSL